MTPSNRSTGNIMKYHPQEFGHIWIYLDNVLKSWEFEIPTKLVERKPNKLNSTSPWSVTSFAAEKTWNISRKLIFPSHSFFPCERSLGTPRPKGRRERQLPKSREIDFDFVETDLTQVKLAKLDWGLYKFETTACFTKKSNPPVSCIYKKAWHPLTACQ